MAVVLSVIILFAPRAPSEHVIPHLDKLVHASLFLALAATTRWRFGPRRWALLTVVAYGIGSELIQWQFLVHRDGDWRDAAADTAGALLGWLVARRLQSRRA